MLAVIFVLILINPVMIFSDTVSFRIGYFIPRAEGSLWDIEFENMTFNKPDFHNTLFSFSYDYFLSNRISLNLAVNGYNKQEVGSYPGFIGLQTFQDWAYPEAFEDQLFPDFTFTPSHALSVSITPVQASIKFTPLGRAGKFIPYIGGGISLYVWSVIIRGDIIDFENEQYDPDRDAPVFPVYQVNVREESKFAVGYHGFAGVMIPVANRISFDGGFRFHSAEGRFSQDFYSQFFGVDTFDLSGYTITVGLNYWF